MRQETATTTMAGVAVAIAALLLLLTKTAVEPAQPAVVQASARCDAPMEASRPLPESFKDLRLLSQHFADQLGRLKEQDQTISPAKLAEQANAEGTCFVPTLADRGKKLDAETIYARTKPGVVVVGGIFKCTKCKQWHVQCASGFVVRQDGLILTNLHTVEAFKKLEALGVMTDDGRVFPVTSVLASSRLNDLALLQVDAGDLPPLPVADDISVGAPVYCLSHPMLPNGKGNAFYSFSQGIVSGKLTTHTDKQQPLNVLAVTADYGPGSSGGPILNEHGAVVAVACQAIPLSQKEGEKNVQMIWRLTRPSSSIMALLGQPAAKREPSRAKKSLVADQASHSLHRTRRATPDKPAGAPVQNIEAGPTASGAVTFALHPCQRPAVGYYRPVQIKLSEVPPVKPKAEPDYQSKTPLYGVLQLGDAEDNRFLVAIDEPQDGEPKIYIDRNGDGDLTSAGSGVWDRRNGVTLFNDNVVINVPYRTGKLPYNLCFYRFKNRLHDCLFYYRNAGREGEVVLDGNRYRVLVLDDNADGRFDDLQNGSLIIDLNQDGKLEGSPDSAEYFHLNEPFNVRDKVWEVSSMSADGLHITLRPSEADVPIKPYLNPGCRAPQFTGKGLDGEAIDLKAAAAESRYVLLDFWASWCGPCRAEFPTLRRAYTRYKDHGLTVIGINLDSEADRAIDAANQGKLAYPHFFDGLGWNNTVALLYRVRGIPQIYLLDSHLTIVGKNLRGAALEQRLRDLLGPGDDEAPKVVDQALPEAKETVNVINHRGMTP